MKESLLKVRTLLLMGLIVFITASCGEDDDADSAGTADITGVWAITSSYVEINVGDKSFVDYLVDVVGVPEADAEEFLDLFKEDFTEGFPETIEFKSDNTYTVNTDGDTESGTWSLSSDGNTLTLDAGTTDETDLDVISLSSTAMKIGFTEEESEDFDDDGVDEIISITFELNFEK